MKILYCIVIFINISYALSFSQSPTDITTTVLMDFPHIDTTQNAWQWSGTEWRSAVAKYNGKVYTSWVTDDLAIAIAQYTDPTNIVIDTISPPGSVVDDAHNHPSIGIDKNGYIHVAGNMHSVAWEYWISDNAEDISSFTFHGGPMNANMIGSFGVSYPNFRQDQNGELYLVYRASASVQYTYNGGKGFVGAFLAHYEIDTGDSLGVWNHLGDDPYTNDGYNAEPIVWSLNGRYSNATGTPIYQTYRNGGPYFDINNTMHYGMTIIGSDGYGAQATHIVYLKKMENESSFTKANGSIYTSLPVTQWTGDSVVSTYPVDSLKTRVSATALTNGNPIVSYQYIGVGNYMKVFNGADWDTEISLPGNQDRAPRIINDYNDNLLCMSDSNIYHSMDAGQTWASFPIDYPIDTWDQKTYAETGVLYYASFLDGRHRVIQLNFSYPVKTNENTVDNSLIAYPNPVKDNVFISGNGYISATLYTCLGQTILKTTQRRINTEHLKKGMYILSLMDEKGNSFVQEMIVE